ncbi:MAG TPA: hypothetical protein VK947_08895, partial [Planococcus sp. (in: firmicutes)]|nr:hypothetical protein [Planococcus sp. (in: firmicutes)]
KKSVQNVPRHVLNARFLNYSSSVELVSMAMAVKITMVTIIASIPKNIFFTSYHVRNPNDPGGAL